jgi:hypothetical protein
MFYRSIAIIFAVTAIATSVQADTHLLQTSGKLKPNKQMTIPLPDIKTGELLSVNVEGSGNSDVDCYLLIKDKSWHVLASDDSKQDSCHINIYPLTSNPIKLWILNSGLQSDNFSIIVN